MKSIKQLLRLLHINTVLARNGLDQLIVSIPLFSAFRFFIYFNPWNWFRRGQVSRGEALRKTLEELGPIFVKFGQALSTRPDILPPDIALELCKLQDKVAPFSSDLVLHSIEAAFGKSPFEVFAEFDPMPLASASVAQVHAATLVTGKKVVVKILRPHIRKIIEKDLSILQTIANLADRYWLESKRLKPKEIVAEFAYSLLNELNLAREAANASQLRRNFQGSSLLYVPEVFWDYCRETILVMERVHGIPVADMNTLKKAHIDLKKLAHRGVEIFLIQVFNHSFFHADMHPGNIFISPINPSQPQYICVDFGIMGTLSDNDKRYLAENLYAFFNRDYRRVAELHVASGWVAHDTRIEEFESIIRTLCEPIFEKPFKDISFAQLIINLFYVARQFHMEVQPQLVLLQKTLLAIEGLGRQVYPELDLWSTAKPFLEKWLRAQIGPGAFLHHLRTSLPFLSEQLPHMPQLLYELLSLSKEQKRRALLVKPTQIRSNQVSWQKTFSMGVLLNLLIISLVAIVYNNVFPLSVAILMVSLFMVGWIFIFILGWKKRS